MRILYHPRKIVPIDPFCCIDSAASDGVSVSLTGKDIYPYSLTFSTDGTEMYFVGVETDSIFQYSLSVAWDLSTVTYIQSKYVGTEDGFPRGIDFSADGTKLVVGGDANDRVYSYTLSIAWDISTATYDNVYFATGFLAVYSIQFGNNGLKLYISSSNYINEYTLTTPYDISTAVYIRQSNMGLSSLLSDFWISDNGINMYVLHIYSPYPTIYQYELSVAWNISTAIQTCASPVELLTTARGLSFSTDGTKHYVTDHTPSITQYSSCPAPIVYTDVNYGYLYNWYAASDARNMANDGWRVPTNADHVALMSYLASQGYTGLEGKVLKEVGDTYWYTLPALATNEYGFNWRGAGYRNDFNGMFENLGNNGRFWSSDAFDATNGRMFQASKTADYAQIVYDNKKRGYSIRLINESTTLSHGQTGTYVGNDGKIYSTICIGTQEWLAYSLVETQYRNLDAIPEVTDNATWAGLTTGARCAYDNNESNAINP